MMCAIACAQDRDDEDDTAKTENKEAEKRVKKAERKSRKEKKSGGTTQLPPPPETPAEFEFFDGAIFSRKVNLGVKDVLCFVSERRPLAVLWQEGGATAAGLPINLSTHELKLIFGRPINAAHISVLNEHGQMLSRGAPEKVSFNLGRRPIYLLLEISPSRPKAMMNSAK
ncbi:MAG: hypothetical protein ONB46_20485 [candidate division KSB1 bacterium]|nr:hypothetical protein [candidate division KSB1 bacterium]MDZ7368203.1 hypothetical protein [candidate division KSB1 bacterium]MDZ7405906.1 hypothetical protein [candidate division KSB1 bacterium]